MSTDKVRERNSVNMIEEIAQNNPETSLTAEELAILAEIDRYVLSNIFHYYIHMFVILVIRMTVLFFNL